MAFGHVIDPEGNEIQAWTGGMNPNYNAHVVRAEWYEAQRLRIYYHAEKSNGTGGTIITFTKTYSTIYTGTGKQNQNVTIVG